jgi:hypothetical protein
MYLHQEINRCAFQEHLSSFFFDFDRTTKPSCHDVILFKGSTTNTPKAFANSTSGTISIVYLPQALKKKKVQ